MHIYCTLLNQLYLSRVLALIDSLEKNAKKYKLYVYAMDIQTYNFLENYNKNVFVINIEDIQTPELQVCRATRTIGEYCWTCTPVICEHALSIPQVTEVTYLDADLFFFSDPKSIFENSPDANIRITPHRFSPPYNMESKVGKYCVQWVSFKNNLVGRAAVQWWKNACIDWCYDRFEEGKFGDQKYLDNWPEQFAGCEEVTLEGAGVAPWNIQQYTFISSTIAKHKKNQEQFTVIFYHFHALKKYATKKWDVGEYQVAKDVYIHIYKPYLEVLEKYEKIVASKTYKEPSFFTKIKRKIRKTYNILELS